jgi:type I site-specific restriction-modification system R (restriction) subunit
MVRRTSERRWLNMPALNMRNALPNAAFIAFTGTPLIFGEEKYESCYTIPDSQKY